MNMKCVDKGVQGELKAAFICALAASVWLAVERGTSEASGVLNEATKAQRDNSCAFQNAVSERAIQCVQLRPTASARNSAGRSTHLQRRAPGSQPQQWLSR